MEPNFCIFISIGSDSKILAEMDMILFMFYKYYSFFFYTFMAINVMMINRALVMFSPWFQLVHLYHRHHVEDAFETVFKTVSEWRCVLTQINVIYIKSKFRTSVHVIMKQKRCDRNIKCFIVLLIKVTRSCSAPCRLSTC